MKRIAGYLLGSALLLAPAGYAADEEEEEAGGLLVGFLEDTLSSESRSIKVIGLEGTFSSRATIEKLVVSDDEGEWLSVEGAVLDWNRLALLRGNFSVNSLGAEKIEVLRAPNPVEAPAEVPDPEAKPFALPELPVAIEIGEINIPSIILGEDLMGESALLSLKGKLQLVDGALDTDLAVERLDRQGDGLRLQADYSNETRLIDLDLDLQEGPGGVFARVLKMPGEPSVALHAKGKGPVEDFGADLRLATGGEDRLTGRVELAAQTNEGQDTPEGIGFTADLGGDVRPLLPEEYQSFFGDNITLHVDGMTRPEGEIAVNDLSLRAAALDLSGRLALAGSGVLETVVLEARVFPIEGQETVLLPLSGPKTHLRAAEIVLRKDSDTGDQFSLEASVTELDRPDLKAKDALITAEGTLDQSEGLLIDALINANLNGIAFADEKLTQAIGDALSLTTRIATDGSGALKLRDLNASGEDYNVQGDFAVKGLSTGMEFETVLTVVAKDLARFSGLAGQDLNGSVSADVTASGAPLLGVYDVDVNLTGDNLSAGIEQVDNLLVGRTTMHLKGGRGYEGVVLDDLALRSSGVEATGKGRLSSTAGTIALDAKLHDLGLVIPGETGPVTLVADVTREGSAITGDVDLKAADGSSLRLDGQANLDGSVDVDLKAFVARLERFVPEFVGNLTADGTATRENGVWNFDVQADAPLGVNTVAKGTFDENTGSADVFANGDLRMDLANPFISPQSVDGTAQFDLTLKGTAEQMVADVQAKLDGFDYSDKAIADAVGAHLKLVTRVLIEGRDSVKLVGLDLEGEDYALQGDVGVAGLSSEMAVEAFLRLGVSNLGRLSGIAGRPVAGSISAAINGTGAIETKQFDLDLDVLGRDLKTGIAQVDGMLVGSTTLQIKADRIDETLSINSFALTAAGFDATAGGQMTGEKGQLRLDAKLNDIGVFVPGNSGPITLAADLTRNGETLDGEVQLDGPSESHATLTGTGDLDGNTDIDFDAVLRKLERFVPQIPGDLTAKGSAQRQSGVWTIGLDSQAPGGVETTVAGTFDESRGEADITAKGALSLEAANLFISPNAVEGRAQFELALKGTPSLEGLSGTISTSGTSVAIPGAKQKLENLAATINIANSAASIQVSAQSKDGGGFRVSGPVELTPPFNSGLDVSLDGYVFTDNLSYTTSLFGNLSHRGALTGSSNLSGQIDFRETEINLANISGSVSSAPIPPMRHIGEPSGSRRTRSYAGLIETSSGGTPPNIGLDILLTATKVFARGRGLYAELGGEIAVKGTAARVAPSGQIELVRGTFDFLGRQLELTKGIVSLQGDLTPYLEFESTTDTSNGTATLEISGPLSAPEIKATSQPERPSEEVLALILFGENMSDLSPLALAQMAASLAELSGKGGGLEGGLRSSTGADDATLGSSGAGLGGYVAENFYTDFTVNTKGETELRLNLDVSESVTLKGTVDQEGETSVGVFFQRDY